MVLKVKVILSVGLVLLLAGCGPDYIFKEYQTIDSKGWDYNKRIDFQFEINDTSKVYNLILDVMHADTFASENAYVKVYTTFPDGKKTEQQLSLELASKTGNWFGKCSSGSCNLLIGLQENVVFAQSGTYKFSLEQFGRSNPLTGLSKIGLIIENTGQLRSKLNSGNDKTKK